MQGKNYIGLVTIALSALMACNSNQQSTETKDTTTLAVADTTAVSELNFSDEKLQNIYSAYIKLKDELVSTKYETAKPAASNLSTALKGFEGCEKTEEKGYPDIKVQNKAGAHFYIEVKVQRRTFMSVEKALPESGLKPSETVALNLSDLNRYFELQQEKQIHIFIFWVLLNRPCVLGEKESQFYYRLASELKPIWQRENDKRKFRRKSGEGDEVDGKHLGVTVNYHFSLNELKVWNNELS